jgi:YD repeat-containing protein
VASVKVPSMTRIAAVCLAAFLGSASLAVAQGSDPTFDASGFQKGRDTFSQLPFEHVDTLTGNLILTFTDVALPGNAGLDLRFQRTYNSKSGLWTFGLAGVPMRILNADEITHPFPFEPKLPQLQLADGGKHEVTTTAENSHVFVSREFWRFDQLAHEVLLPNGLVCEFGYLDSREQDPDTAPNGHNVRYLTAVRDLFGNRLELSYQDTPSVPVLSQIHQELEPGHARDLTLGYDNDTQLRFVSFLGRTIEYRYAPGTLMLTDVVPPTGPGWHFGYGDQQISVTTPHGGVIGFDFESHVFQYEEHTGPQGGTGSLKSIVSRVVRHRTQGGRGLAGGTWTYTYSEVLAADKTTVVEGPGKTVTYHYFRLLPDWVLDRRTVSEGASTLEVEEMLYQQIPVGSVNDDPFGTSPFISHRTVSRGGRSWVTHYTYSGANFGDYGRPFLVEETGELSRQTTREFEYDFGANYVRDRTRTETVTVAGEAFARSFNYNRDTAFLEGETIYGIHTGYGHDGRGNRASATDAHGHTTTSTYEWGTLKDTTTLSYTIARSINPDGTVAASTRRGFTTTFGYDELGRLRTSQPPRGFATTIDYAPDGSWIRVSRGPGGVQTETTISLDGVGRKVGTSNLVGVKTAIEYDAEGRKVRDSYPFSGTPNPPPGTAYAYDGLDRLTGAVNQDGSSARYDYSAGIDVTITDEEGHVTAQDWSAFGDPSDARLMSVTDGEGHTFAYAYNGLGRLTQVDQPNAPARRWTYWPGQDLLKDEIQPESGTTSFAYDAAGRLDTKSDASGVFGFGYDADDRLTSIDAPGTADDVTMSYDASDNRTDVGNGTVASHFDFDEANRLARRRDTVAGQLFETGYTYDDWDNLKRIDYPSGHSADYDYDREGRLTRVMRDPNATLVAEVQSYFPWGQIESLRYGNGIVETFTADNRTRLHSISGGPLGLTYDYDRVGNVTQIADARPDHTQTFGYDRVDRLKTVGGFGARSFDYDALGNRTLKVTPFGTTTYGYNGATLRLETVGGNGGESDSPGYDGKGNVRTSAGVTFAYTPFNMVRTASKIVGGDTQTTEYRYDGDNIRFLKIPPTGPSEYTIHGTAGQLLSEFESASPAPTWKRDHLYLGSRLIATISAPQASVGFSPAAKMVQETDGSVSTTVVVTTPDGLPLKRDLTVQFATVAGTAQAGTDFVAQTGTLTFPANTPSGASQPITVGIVDDHDYEENEQFTIQLSSVTNGSIVGGTFAATIVDNDPHPIFHLDEPAASSTHFTPFIVGGWVFDGRAASGTGVDAVTVTARAAGGAETLLGPAAYGGTRPDVGNAFGAQFAASGFTMQVTANLAPGEYDLIVSAHYVADGLTRALPPVHVTIEASEKLTVDAPTEGQTLTQQFVVTGWAIDREAAAGTGVDQVLVRAYPSGGAPAIELGPANFGDRTDVGTQYGARFTPSGYGLIVNTLPPGSYRLEVDARSTVSARFTKSVNITLASSIAMNVDVPTATRPPTQQIVIGGWAIDTAAASGTGVSRVEISAFSVPGDVPKGQWTATYGGSRPDIGTGYGARFQPSGFGAVINTLLEGTYRLDIKAFSTFGTATMTRSVNVTIASDARMAVDAPAATTPIWTNRAFHIGGWAADLNAAAAPGVSSVDIWALPTGQTGGAPVFLGQAVYGAPRQDVATALERPDLVNVGFGLNPAGLPAGTYSLRMSLFSTISNTIKKEQFVNITVADSTLVTVDGPVEGRSGGQAFTVSGFAIDRAAPTGTGVSFVNVKAVRLSNGAVTDLGNAAYGSASSAAAAYGQQFAPSGFSLTSTSLAAGTYRIEVRARSAITGTDLPVVCRTITITSTPITQLDAPASMQTTGLRIILGGWAIDTSAATTTGVDYVDAYAQPSAGGAETYLGRANVGDRPDIAAAYGAQFRPSGFGLAATLPSIGTWVVKVKAHSTLSGNLDVKTVTIVAASNPRMAIETPVNNSLTGQPFTISGWGIDLSTAAGTGADTVHVWATPAAGGNAVMLGASYGIPRDNVAAAYGEQFRNSGFSISASGLAPGTYVIVAYLHSTVTGDFSYTQSVTVTIPTPHVLVNIDAPAANAVVGQPFALTGWAIDTAHPTAVGVSMLHIYAYPATGGPPVFLGVATTGGSRPDVGAAYGSRFTPSGWGITPSGLSPGWYTLVLYPWSTVTQDFRFEAAVTRVVYVAY